jgi:hypothetical protein
MKNKEVLKPEIVVAALCTLIEEGSVDAYELVCMMPSSVQYALEGALYAFAQEQDARTDYMTELNFDE